MIHQKHHPATKIVVEQPDILRTVVKDLEGLVNDLKCDLS